MTTSYASRPGRPVDHEVGELLDLRLVEAGDSRCMRGLVVLPERLRTSIFPSSESST